MRFGICLANIGTYSDPRTALRIARAAEASGWDGLFVWDHLAFVWGPPAADPWVTLAAVAAETTRIRIGTAVTPVARRPAPEGDARCGLPAPPLPRQGEGAGG